MLENIQLFLCVKMYVFLIIRGGENFGRVGFDIKGLIIIIIIIIMIIFIFIFIYLFQFYHSY